MTPGKKEAEAVLETRKTNLTNPLHGKSQTYPEVFTRNYKVVNSPTAIHPIGLGKQSRLNLIYMVISLLLFQTQHF